MNRLKFPVFMMTLLSSVAVFAAAQPAAQPAPASKPITLPAITVNYSGLTPMNVTTGDHALVMQITSAGQITIPASKLPPQKKGSSLQLVFSPDSSFQTTPSSPVPSCVFNFFLPKTGALVLQAKEKNNSATCEATMGEENITLTVNIPDPKTIYASCINSTGWKQNAQQITVPYMQSRGSRGTITGAMGKELEFLNFFVYTCVPHPNAGFQLSCSVVTRPGPTVPTLGRVITRSIAHLNTPISFDYISGGVTSFVDPPATFPARCTSWNLRTSPTGGNFTETNCAKCYTKYPAQQY